MSLFSLEANITDLPESEIKSGGYVIKTLDTSIWCLLTTTSYKEAVLKAVNLGNDTDTAAVTGGLAGIFYGIDTALRKWYETVARVEEIEGICDRLTAKYAEE